MLGGSRRTAALDADEGIPTCGDPALRIGLVVEVDRGSAAGDGRVDLYAGDSRGTRPTCGSAALPCFDLQE